VSVPIHGATRAAALIELRRRLEHAGIDTAAAEAEAILLHGLGLSRAALWCEPDAAVAPEEASALESLARRRERRVPLQHLLGEVDFHEVTLDVRPGVFVPRPETESLVEAAIEAIEAAAGPAARGVPGTIGAAGGGPDGVAAGRLLDLGTGTGAVAIALLQALPAWTGVAVDRCPKAVALAVRNAARSGC
jgi:release factor glutamine methyltransferase